MIFCIGTDIDHLLSVKYSYKKVADSIEFLPTKISIELQNKDCTLVSSEEEAYDMIRLIRKNQKFIENISEIDVSFLKVIQLKPVMVE